MVKMVLLLLLGLVFLIVYSASAAKMIEKLFRDDSLFYAIGSLIFVIAAGAFLGTAIVLLLFKDIL